MGLFKRKKPVVQHVLTGEVKPGDELVLNGDVYLIEHLERSTEPGGPFHWFRFLRKEEE